MNETAKRAADAILALNSKVEDLAARVVSMDLVLIAIMETHPDLPAVLAALERSLNPTLAAEAGNPSIAKAAQDRAANLLAMWRRGDQAPAPAE